MIKHIYFLLANLLLFQVPLFAEMRMWRNIDGTGFVGEYVTERLDRYYFQDKDGETQIIPVKSLVPNDEKYIRTIIPPKIEIRFKKNEYIQQGEYADADMTIIEGLLEITKVSRQPFYGKFNGELYYIGDEVATDDHMILAKNKFVVQFPEEDEKNPTVKVRLQAEARAYHEYNGIQVRGRSFGGYVAVLFSSTGEIMEFKTNINWLTDNKIEAFLQLEEFNFFNEDCQKRPVPRMKNYKGRRFMSQAQEMTRAVEPA